MNDKEQGSFFAGLKDGIKGGIVRWGMGCGKKNFGKRV